MLPATVPDWLRDARMRPAIAALLLCAAPAWATPCEPGASRAELEALRESRFELPDDARRQALALGLVDCLGDPDPAIRDGIAFGALEHWLRADAVASGTRQAMFARLLAASDPAVADGDGFRRPFAILVLSEIARTDRLHPWMDEAARRRLLDRAVEYLTTLRDYRGFDPHEGWRHGVAHGADLVTQLSLNPAFGRAEIDRLMAAVASQVMPPVEHAYVDGEPERLARAVLYAAQRGLHDADDWQSWFEHLMEAPAGRPWTETYARRDILTRRHNLAAFLYALYVNVQEGGQPGFAVLLPGLRAALRALP
jgi:hypothetical protein